MTNQNHFGEVGCESISIGIPESFYLSEQFWITLSIAISANSQDFYEVNAKLDSGSVFCILQRHYAKLLKLDLEAGISQRIRTATGSFLAYGHEIIISIEGIEWQATVFFAADEYFPVNVVGRVGF